MTPDDTIAYCTECEAVFRTAEERERHNFGMYHKVAHRPVSNPDPERPRYTGPPRVYEAKTVIAAFERGKDMGRMDLQREFRNTMSRLLGT